MSNIEGSFPGALNLIERSEIRTAFDIESMCLAKNILPKPEEIRGVGDLFTPTAILKQPNHQGRIITLDEFPNFNALLSVRNEIRDLNLVPKRTDEVQKDYERMTSEGFLKMVEDYYLRETRLVYVKEIYPTDLPDDVDQHVVWLANGSTKQEVEVFIAKILKLNKLTEQDVILFERSRVSTTQYVAAAIDKYRHIHVWTRKV
ncbi:hypothetical protein KKE48_05915 [Patescibacteria group bacterium]|nr:hypothetical protein [Patescibacteria group bacterium]